VDRCPTKTFMLEEPAKRSYPREFALSFGRRPPEELYRIADDPSQVNNLAEEPRYASTREELSEALAKHLAETGDPRSRGESPWDYYPYRRAGQVQVATRE
jgi:uncharacterized sulfatase